MTEISQGSYLDASFDIQNEFNYVEDIIGEATFFDYSSDYPKSLVDPDFFDAYTKLLKYEPNSETKSHKQNQKNGESYREYLSGTINACQNLLDRHNSEKKLLMFETNTGNLLQFTQKLLYERVQMYSKILDGYLTKYQIESIEERASFVVTIFMPVCPDTASILLACSRLGLPHSVVFAGYSSNSLLKRMKDSNSKLLVATDFYNRGSKCVEFEDTLNNFIDKTEPVDILLVSEKERKIFESKGEIIHSSEIPDIDNSNKSFSLKNKETVNIEFLNPSRVDMSKNIECVMVPVSHPLFYLYTSGSTGLPKGIVHNTGNYLLYAIATMLQNFYNPNIEKYNTFAPNVESRDGKSVKDRVFFCTADFGWITGHTYSLYGPFSLGLNTVISAGIPNYPRNKIYNTIEKSKCGVFYTAPTLIRSLIDPNNSNEIEYKKNDLRIIGSVGEPLNTDARDWVQTTFRTRVVDTYWQTETGGHMLSGVNGCKPMYGIMPKIMTSLEYSDHHLVDTLNLLFHGDKSLANVKEQGTKRAVKTTCEMGSVCFNQSWPGLAKTVIGDHEKYRKTYFSMYDMYFSGDQGYVVHDFFESHDLEKLKVEDVPKEIKDCICYQFVKDGILKKTKKVKIETCIHYSYVITGRSDDVLNVSGHRISTQEVEDAVTALDFVGECAVVGKEDKSTGECIILFLHLTRTEGNVKDNITKHLKISIGSHVKPARIYLIEELPKTRTGKIMRRTLRSILKKEPFGDVSTCANSNSLDDIKELVDNDQFV